MTNGKKINRKTEKQRNGEAEKQMTERFPRSGMTYDSMSSEGTAKAAWRNREAEKRKKRKAEKQRNGETEKQRNRET